MQTRAFCLMLVTAAFLYSGQLLSADKVIYPLRQELSSYHRTVSTSSSEAQAYFDQGLSLYWGFNHEAAIASFREAQKLDPQMAMAYWGEAISLGPHINYPFMDSTATRSALAALKRATELAAKHIDRAAPVERDLINALESRYAFPPPADRMPLNIAYADAMRKVWRSYPEDPDVGALFADAMMNLRPWHLWTSAGEPQPGTMEIMATLEQVMAMVPDHPGACHFYVHTVEASPFPQLAMTAANTLRRRMPGAGHLVHMPAHIDIRLGHYPEAIKANELAVLADTTYISQGGFYTIYRAHNYHFLTYSAMFDGQKDLAMRSAREMIEQIPIEVVRAFPDFLDAFYAVPYHVMVRFGLWEQLLAEPAPPEDLQATTAFWRYARTVANASLGRVKEAETELAALKAAYAATPASRTLGNNTAHTVLDIGLLMAEGELEYRKQNYDRAFDLLAQAVVKDDALKYDEPWGWMMPVRHALGALLLEQNHLATAELVYREDLRLHPDNGWALLGLAECQRKGGRMEEAQLTEAAFRDAWARSDIVIKASCFCSRAGS